jgi:hypothetical protein
MTNISKIGSDTGPGKTVSPSKADTTRWKSFLSKKTISLSISESENLGELGFDVIHLKDAIIELSRYIVAAGGSLAFGGDMRQGGITELLFDLLAYYKADNDLHPSERLFSYLAYPISTSLSNDKMAELRQVVTFIKVPPPDDVVLNNPEAFLPYEGEENQYSWSRCLTAMRQKIESACDAKILLGGRFSGFRGKYPGVLEEFDIAADHKKPMYLIAAFGGVTSAVFRALSGEKSQVFDEEFYSTDENYSKLMDVYLQRRSGEPIDYKGLFTKIQSLGIKGISESNGLSIEENLRLGKTSNIGEIVYLVLKGLTNLFTGAR